MKQQEWEIIESVCTTPGAEGVPVYGVVVHDGDGYRWTWPDVDVDRAVVSRLVMRLQSLQPERCHFEAMVLDYIHEVAGTVQ